MAKRGRKGGTGQVITIRRMKGLGSLRRPGSFAGAVLPPALGAGVTLGAALATRYFVKPAEGDTPMMLYKHAPWVGLVAGALVSGGLYVLGGAPAAFASGATSLLTAVGIFAHDKVVKEDPASYQAAALSGTGVVVSDTIGTRGAMGALMFENPASRDPVNRYGVGGMGSYGQTVNATQGISPSAFGRSHIS